MILASAEVDRKTVPPVINILDAEGSKEEGETRRIHLWFFRTEKPRA